MITSAVKSRQKPDEHIGTILELDVHSSLLPFVIPGMQTVLAKEAYADSDGRLLLHKLFREYVKRPDGLPKEHVLIGDESTSDSDGSRHGHAHDRQARTERRKPVDPRKLHPVVLESFITSSASNEIDEFSIDLEQLSAEFDVVLTDTDVRRALRRIGDVTLVDKVNLKKTTGKDARRPVCIIDQDQYEELKQYIREYCSKEDLPDKLFDALFTTWEENDSPMPETTYTALGDKHDKSGAGALLPNNHHPAISYTKWKNVKFENVTRMADFVVDTRSVRICGSTYERDSRIRRCAFFEFSTDDTMKSGAHTAGNLVERASSRRSEYPREFAEALFFLTVDFDWDKFDTGFLEDMGVDKERLPGNFFLCYCHPLSVRQDAGLTILNRIRKTERKTNSRTRNRKYKDHRWLDVDDFVDLVGLLYCREEEYICWRDACWDPVERSKIDPIDWTFPDDDSNDTDTNKRQQLDADIQMESSSDNDLVDMDSWTESDEGISPTKSRVVKKKTKISSDYHPGSLAGPDSTSSIGGNNTRVTKRKRQKGHARVRFDTAGGVNNDTSADKAEVPVVDLVTVYGKEWEQPPEYIPTAIPDDLFS